MDDHLKDHGFQADLGAYLRSYTCPGCSRHRLQLTKHLPHPPRECGFCGWQEQLFAVQGGAP